ncbi:MAG: OmpH family outer membrane protein [Kiritimatiellae bacterium]|nr:OmpH family outer membrane protein [Kiritimatiellia bacterium]
MAEKKSLGMFEIIYILMLAALLIVSVIYMGRPKVGIINLSRAAKDLGVTSLIEADLSNWRDIAAGDLKKMNAEYAAVGKGMKAKFDAATSDSEKAELKAQMSSMSREYSAHIIKIKGRVQLRQQKVLHTFRKRLNPFIIEVSRKRKLWVVLDNSARLVYSTSQVDVTDAVVAAARDSFAKQDGLLDVDEDLILAELPVELPAIDVEPGLE